MAGEDNASQKKRPWGALIAALVVAIVVALIAVLGGGYLLVQQQLEKIPYEARILSVSPDAGCISMLRDMGTSVVDDLTKVITNLPFPIGVEPDDLKPDAGEEAPDAAVAQKEVADVEGGDALVEADAALKAQGDASQALRIPTREGSADPPEGVGATPEPPGVGADPEPKGAPAPDGAGEADAPEPEEVAEEGDEDDFDCNATVTMRVEVQNPLPLTMQARIMDVQVKVARQSLKNTQIEYGEPELEAESGGVLAKEVRFHLNIQQIMAAASGILLRQKLPLVAEARIKVSVLGGLVSRVLVLPVSREITVKELLAGLTTGTVTAEEVEGVEGAEGEE